MAGYTTSTSFSNKFSSADFVSELNTLLGDTCSISANLDSSGKPTSITVYGTKGIDPAKVATAVTAHNPAKSDAEKVAESESTILKAKITALLSDSTFVNALSSALGLK